MDSKQIESRDPQCLLLESLNFYFQLADERGREGRKEKDRKENRMTFFRLIHSHFIYFLGPEGEVFVGTKLLSKSRVSKR